MLNDPCDNQSMKVSNGASSSGSVGHVPAVDVSHPTDSFSLHSEARRHLRVVLATLARRHLQNPVRAHDSCSIPDQGRYRGVRTPTQVARLLRAGRIAPLRITKTGMGSARSCNFNGPQPAMGTGGCSTA
jgi:hypothetical protein